MRVLLVKRDKLGDLLLTTPAIAHLAAALPHAEIHLLANDYNAWVVREHPALTRTWVYPRVRSAGRMQPLAALRWLPVRFALRRMRFDAVLVMNGDETPRGIRRALALGARRVIAYAHEPAAYGTRLTDALPVPTSGHEVERLLALTARLGVAPPREPADPAYRLPGQGARFAREWLAAQGLAPGGYVVLGLGARRAKKQPSTAQVLAWGERLMRDHALPTVFMWTPGARNDAGYPGDDDIAAPVLAHGASWLRPFRGPVDEAIGLIFHARTSILPDSGLMHFAAASPGGVLGLFADPADSAPAERWAPRGPRARFLEAPQVVAQLPQDVVFEALAPLLAGEGVPRHAGAVSA